jgi:hypothetical protein
MMRATMVTVMLVVGGAAMLGQQVHPYRPGVEAPPEFAADDAEGLVMSGPRGDGRYAHKRKVFWKISQGSPLLADRRVPAHTAAERQAMTRTLDALTGILEATPSGSQGEGYWVQDSRHLDYVDVFRTPPDAPLARWPLTFDTALFPFYHDDTLRNGTWRLSVAGETESVRFAFNRLPDNLPREVLARESAVGDREPVEMYLRPRVTDTWAGWPVYERDLLVVTRPGRDPWAPVSMGRALAATLAEYEKDRKTADDRLATLKQKHDEVRSDAWEQQMRDTFEKNNGALRTTRPSNFTTRLASLEHEIRVTRERAAREANPQRNAEGAWYWNPVDALDAARARLAALTPADAAAPACYTLAPTQPRTDGSRPDAGRYATKGDIVPVGSVAGCRDIVVTNPYYFDTSLPRTAPQILTIGFGRCAQVRDGAIVIDRRWTRNTPPHGCYRHRIMWSEADWSAITALVVP